MKNLSVARVTILSALMLAVPTALIIWWWGLRMEVTTELIASSSQFPLTQGAPADQISILPDGNFLALKNGRAVYHCTARSNRLELRSIFDLPRIASYIEHKQSPDSSRLDPSWAHFEVDPVVFPDASRIVVYYKGFLAVFPHDWTGKDQDVASLELQGSNVPVALAVIKDRIVVAYEDGTIQFRYPDSLILVDNDRPTTLPSLMAGAAFVDLPSTMKAFGDRLAVASIQTSKISVLNVQDLYSIETVKEAHFPKPIEGGLKFDVSDNGRIAVGSGSNNVYVTDADGRGDASHALTVFGRVRAISFVDNNHIAAGGDFSYIALLTEGEAPFKIADAEGGVSALGLSSNRLAFSSDRLVLMSYVTSKTLNRTGWGALYGFILVTMFAGFSAYRSQLKKRFEEQRSSAIPVGPVVIKPDIGALPVPKVPAELVKAMRDGECVLYCGSGISAQAGFPHWPKLVEDLTEWAISNKFVDASLGASLRAALEQQEYDSVSDNLVSITRDHQAELIRYFRGIFTKSTLLPDSVKLLKNLPLSGVMTINFDYVLDQAFIEKTPSALTPSDAELLLQHLQKREFFLLKLYGKLEQPDSIMLAPSQYDDLVRSNLQFAQFMQTLLISRTVFFVGSGLEGIEAYLKGMPLSRQNLRPHYALLAVTGEAWQAKAKPLKERYGIEVLPYTPSAGNPEMFQFLEKLTAQINEEPEREVRSDRESLLKKLSLIDLGPFEKLELNFDPHWNILLGDNGVGKSSIIKAIAISILGEDSRAYAHRLIKSGKPNSTITLETSRNIYTTNIFRKNGEARVESIPGRAFEAEGWLAIGFPPIRTASWVRPRAIETYSRGRPKSDDLLPVVIGDPDPRIDRLKQWIVNIDYWIKDARSRNQDPRPYERLLEDFFAVVSELTAGTRIEFKEVNVKTNEITIITDDGELPIEALSQGMITLIGWVGFLLQRLHEVYGTDEDANNEDPKQRYALVLMDEIDAHLHPAWQQTLTRKLSKLFPNVQFIATTHSPLIVSGMKPQQVIRFARDEDEKVVTYKVEEEMTIGRADQILTSDLFGLESTAELTEDLDVLMNEYHELLATDRNETQEARFQHLREILKSRIPAAGETPPERKAMALIRLLLQPDNNKEYKSTIQETLRAAEELLNEVAKKKK